MPVPPKLLIDGYNLLFQSNLVGRGRGPGWLERARRRLLGLLGQGLSPAELGTTQVIFDASRPGNSDRELVVESGMLVTFAVEHPEADDLLEQVIRTHPQPKSLRVVSSDQRIRRCARARRAESIDSESFLSTLERAAELSQTIDAPQKLAEEQAPESPLSESEIGYWLEEFRKAPKRGNAS